MEMRARLWLACVALGTLVHAQERCESAQIGNETIVGYVLEERRVEPDVFSLEIREQDICADSGPTGLKVTACDADKAPLVFAIDLTRGLVIRKGNLETAAYVYITVFCASDSDKTSDESSESSPKSSWYRSTSTPPPQVSSALPTNSLQLLNDELDSIPSTTSKSLQSEPKSEDSLLPVHMESRFSSASRDVLSSLGQLKGLSSRLKDQMAHLKHPLIPGSGTLWNRHAPPSYQKFKTPLPESLSTKWNNELLSSDKSKQLFSHPPRNYDSYSSLTDVSVPSLAKRLPEFQPEYATWLSNRAPVWMKRATSHPSSTLLKQRNHPDWPTRKSLSWSPSLSARFLDDGNEWWSPYEDDPFLLNWAGERIDPYPWWTDNQHLSHPVKAKSWQSWPRYGLAQNEAPTSLTHERQMPLSIKHSSKINHKHIPPFQEEDAVLLAELKNQHLSQAQWSKPTSLPKLLLLLQEHPPSQKNRLSLTGLKCASAHSVEDSEPWWPTNVLQNVDDGFPWQLDYSTDYSAEDSDSWPFAPVRHDDESDMWRMKHSKAQYLIGPNKEHSSSSLLELLDQSNLNGSPVSYGTEHPSTGCAKCSPVISDDRKHLRPPLLLSRYSKDTLASSQSSGRPLYEYNHALGPDPFANYVFPSELPSERPMPSSTVRYPVSWVKNTRSASALRKPISAAKQLEHPPPGTPWSFLSRLLVSHPSFRDSTHVIRI